MGFVQGHLYPLAPLGLGVLLFQFILHFLLTVIDIYELVHLTINYIQYMIAAGAF